ncbi:MAG: 3-dehydroquinate synthase [Clostridiales bacterium]|nr:3-dehydroquinate synthase [Clostridiales bacterium]
MKTIEINTARPYKVVVGSGLIGQTGELAAPLIRGRKAVIVAGSNVFPLYGEAVRESLERAGFSVCSTVYPAGEKSKTADTLVDILNFLAEHQLTRADAVFALGGGVTGDMAGLAAALYQRGITCVQLPTTLLAAVDSSVGGKTAVNLKAGKNQMGVFSQPALVVCDTDCLKTLPPEVYTEGWAEVVKYAFIRQGPLQELLLAEKPEERIEEIIAECVKIKRDVVTEDEFDLGTRQLLNFGHTIGHAIEKCSGYSWYHGMAVAVGMAMMIRACRKKGICDEECLEKAELLLKKFGLPQDCEYPAEALLEAAVSDKKRSGGTITLVLPESFGVCTLQKTPFEQLGELIALGKR